MNVEIRLLKGDKVVDLVGHDAGAFVSGHTGFIITHCMKVEPNSVGLVLGTLKDLGYSDLSKLGTMVIDFGSKEVMSLLECLFSSAGSLTDAFLSKGRSNTKMNMAVPLDGLGCGSEISSGVICLNVFC